MTYKETLDPADIKGRYFNNCDCNSSSCDDRNLSSEFIVNYQTITFTGEALFECKHPVPLESTEKCHVS